MKCVIGLVLAVGLLFAGSASGQVVFGDGGAALQGVLNGITLAPNPGVSSVNVVTDQMGFDEHWSITGTGGSITTIIIELAAFAGGNEFGVFDMSNPGTMVTVFTGAAVAGNQAALSIGADGSVFVNFVDTGVDFAGNAFGYFLNVTDTGNRWYSRTSLNADGMDHLAAYQGKDIDTVQLPGKAPGLWTDNEYVLAFEDLAAPVSDRDYTDFVAMVESVNPVPEPTSLLLIGLGMAGMGLARRRRR